MPPVLLLALLNPVADITVSRTVNSISAGTGKLTLAGGSCKSSDAYGSNDCVLDWGKSYTAAANGTLTKAIESGDTFTADFTVDELLHFKFTCQLCGVDCSFTLPVVRKHVSFAMPACPITAGAVHVSKSFTLPTSSPIPLKSGFKGTVIAQDKAGNSLASINVQQHVPRATAPLSSARLCGSCASLARLVAWRSWVLLGPRRPATGLGCSSEKPAMCGVTAPTAVGHPGAGGRVGWRRRPARRGRGRVARYIQLAQEACGVRPQNVGSDAFNCEAPPVGRSRAFIVIYYMYCSIPVSWGLRPRGSRVFVPAGCATLRWRDGASHRRGSEQALSRHGTNTGADIV